MIAKKQFITLSPEQQKEFLANLIGEIETEKNQELLLCQRLLEAIPSPSGQVLEYIYDIIDGQLQGYHTKQATQQTEKITALLEHIRQEEALEKEDVEKILLSI